MCRTDRGVILGIYRFDPDRELLEQALSIGVRGLDTAYNYAGFASHRFLARTASDLLTEFTVSTKVGFFPRRERSEHSLDPTRLRDAVRQSVDDLGRMPDVIFLHNPEESLATLAPEEGHGRLVRACAVLTEATATGLAGSWGISSWNPTPLLIAFDHARVDAVPTPDVLMVRAGLTVVADGLHVAEELSARLGIGPDGRWGMSPFGGSTADRAWQTTNIRTFLQLDQSCSNLQAAFRVAFELPRVHRIAVGTTSVDHLRQLVAATGLRVEGDVIGRYRELIRAESS